MTIDKSIAGTAMPATGSQVIRIYLELIKSTGIYSIAVIAERAASFLLLPIYTHFLTTADYGILELLNLSSSLVGMILGVRLGQALFYYYFATDSDGARHEFISTAIWGALIAGTIMGGLLLPSAGVLSRWIFGTGVHTFQFQLMLASLAASLPVEVGLSYLRVSNRPKAYVITLLTRLLLGVILNVTFLAAAHLGLSAMLWSSLIISALTAVSLAWYCFSRVGLLFSTKKLAQLLWYSLPLGVSGIAMFVVHFCDRFFLRTQVSLSEIGIYALAYQIGWIVAVIQLPFVNYWNARALAILQGPSGERVYVRTCTYMMLALSATAVLVCVFTRPVLTIMVPPPFRACAKYVPLLAAGYLLRALGDFMRYILVLEKRNSWDAAVTTLGAVTALLGYGILIPRYKLWGAVEATLAAFLLMLIAGYWKAQRTRPFHYEYLRMFQIGVCASIPMVIANLAPPLPLAADLGLAFLSAVLFPALLWLCGFTTYEEKQRLRMVLSSFRWRQIFA